MSGNADNADPNAGPTDPNAPSLLGGRRMSRKSSSKKTAKAAAPAKKAKAAEPAPAKKSKKGSKKGGSADLMQNVAGLAVPFAFLLAKQGLAAMKKSDKKSETPKPASAKKSASPAKSSSSKKTASMSGGAAAKLEALRANIDAFLSKY